MTITNICAVKLYEDAVLPTKGSKKAAGYDLYAYIPKQTIKKDVNNGLLFFSFFSFFFAIFIIFIFLNLSFVIPCVTIVFIITIYYINNKNNDTNNVLKRTVQLLPNKRMCIQTGISIEIPIENCYGRIAPRSGLSIKYGIDIGGGVIDSDYRGEIIIILFNHGEKPFEINHQDRVAQLIFETIAETQIVPETCLSETDRGTNGFGSTGT